MRTKMMFAARNRGRRTKTERGAVIVWTAVGLTVLIGFVALAVDSGYVRVVRTQLQAAADAAAMAGASALLSPAVEFGASSPETLVYEANNRASAYAGKNQAASQYLSLDVSDVSVGYIADTNDLDVELAAGVQPYNAVYVRVLKTSGSSNGPLDLIFGSVLGKSTASLGAGATAVLDGRMYAYRPVDNVRGPAIPVTIWKQKWLDEIINGAGEDNYGFDPVTGEVTLGPDGIPEISIYPQKQKDIGDEEDGSGNFGLLNIGTGNQGVPAIGDQIRNGLTEENIIGAFGESEIRFYTEDGAPINHVLDGTPGVKNSLIQLEDDFRSRLGTVIGFFLHDAVIESGANSQYNVVNMHFGRLMDLNARGSVNDKAVVIQPVAYVGQEIITGKDIIWHGTGGRIRLVR